MPTFKKSKQKHGLYSEEKLKMAVADVIEKRFSLRKAASIYDIPRTTVRTYVNRAKESNSQTKKCSMVTQQVRTLLKLPYLT